MPNITDWISAFANSVSAVGVVFGLAIAWWQLEGWRKQALLRRKVEVADDILSSAHEVDDLMRNVRSPLESIPVDQLHDKSYVYREKDRRLRERGAAFQNLRKAQIKARYLIQDKRLDDAVEKIFQTRIDFWNALDVMVDYVDADNMTAEEKDMVKESRRKVVGTFNDKDDIFRDINESIQKLELLLGPIMRLND